MLEKRLATWTDEQKMHFILWSAVNEGRHFPGFRAGQPWPAITDRERAERVVEVSKRYRDKKLRNQLGDNNPDE